MIEYTTQTRPRYGEVDQMGFVYHANYVTYFDVARTEMIRSFGLTNKSMEQDGVMLPVVSVEIQYINPASYDELLTIKVVLKSRPTAFIIFDYEVFNELGDLITTATVKLAFMNSKTKRATRPHKKLMEIIDSKLNNI